MCFFYWRTVARMAFISTFELHKMSINVLIELWLDNSPRKLRRPDLFTLRSFAVAPKKHINVKYISRQWSERCDPQTIWDRRGSSKGPSGTPLALIFSLISNFKPGVCISFWYVPMFLNKIQRIIGAPLPLTLLNMRYTQQQIIELCSVTFRWAQMNEFWKFHFS